MPVRRIIRAKHRADGNVERQSGHRLVHIKHDRAITIGFVRHAVAKPSRFSHDKFAVSRQAPRLEGRKNLASTITPVSSFRKQKAIAVPLTQDINHPPEADEFTGLPG